MGVPDIPELPEIEEPEREGGNNLWRSGKLALFLAAVFGYYKLPFPWIVVPVIMATGAEYMRFRFSKHVELGWAIIGILFTSTLFCAGLYGAGWLISYFWPTVS